jgi:hypothetical protein
MFKYSDCCVDATKILSRRELAAVLGDLEPAAFGPGFAL